MIHVQASVAVDRRGTLVVTKDDFDRRNITQGIVIVFVRGLEFRQCNVDATAMRQASTSTRTRRKGG
jgi:hypothetical protein